MKCFHHNDADGRLSAFLVAQQHPGCFPEDFIEMDYRTRPDIGVIVPQERVYIVDFSFSPEDMTKLLHTTDNVVWIDHHVSAIEKLQDFKQLRGLRDTSRAACALTWLFFNPIPIEVENLPLSQAKVPDFVYLVEDYDIWRLSDPRTMAFRFGLELHDQHPTGELWKLLYDQPGNVATIQDQGETVLKYRAQLSKEFKNIGFYTTFHGHKTFACNFFRGGSQFFETMGLDKDTALYAPFFWDGKQWTVSLYAAQNNVDCRKIAEEHGGGGHPGAAGFVCEQLPLLRK